MTKSSNQEYLKAFGNHVRLLRKGKGLSMTELANLCEIEYRQVSDIELGKINTTLSTIKILASALKLEPKELLDF